jgi:hypothetical protein
MQRNSFKEHFFKVCPKTNRIRGVRTDTPLAKTFFVVTALIAVAWVLIRSLPKPSRLSYACQQISLGYIASFFSMVFGIAFLRAAIKKIPGFIKKPEFKVAALIVGLMAGAMAFFVVSGTNSPISAESTGNFNDNKAQNPANTPIGTSDAIFPGRVAWSHIPGAAKFNGNGNWYDENNNDQTKIDSMMLYCVWSLAGSANLDTCWNKLFKTVKKRFNKDEGYKTGEKIAIKLNLNNYGRSKKLDSSPQLALSIAKQLVAVGVKEEDITFYDVTEGRNDATGFIKDYLSGKGLTKINYVTGNWNTTKGSIQYSNGFTNEGSQSIANPAKNCQYLINMALLKRQCAPGIEWQDSEGQTGVTLCAKNHYGSVGHTRALHAHVQDWKMGYGKYNNLVDLLSHPDLGKKTVLYVLDGLYSSKRWDSEPVKWSVAPFGTSSSPQYPSSVFASQDVIALESVGVDLLHYGMGLPKCSDNYLHEAAQIGNPPSRTKYTYASHWSSGSIGVHEHWNNSSEMKYSRNLNPSTGKGIELIKARGAPITSIQTKGVKNTNTNFGIIRNGSRNFMKANVDGNFTLSIFSADGSLVKKFSGQSNKLIELNNIAAGNYTAVINSKDITSSENIIIH